jgi:organic hydroperoxide reductase OsmC/OhrA
MSTFAEPRVRYKSFVYRASCEWLGRRIVRVEASGKPSLLISAPPEFKGENGFWSPEELFVAAVDGCVTMSFAAHVQLHDLPVEAYFSEAIGHLEFFEGAYRVTKLTLKPTIIVTAAESAPLVEHALQASVHECSIARSVRSEIELQPDIQISRPQ